MKETVSKVKKQPSELEKILAKTTIDKKLYPKYKNSSCSSTPEKPTTKLKSGPKN